MPQASGPYQTIIYDEYGELAGNGSKLINESWGIIDVGYYTTDFMVFEKGRFLERGAGSTYGIHNSVDKLMKILAVKNITLGLSDCESLLRERKLLNFGEEQDFGADVDESLDYIVGVILSEAERRMKDKVMVLNGVLLAGGGAPLIFRKIRAKWPHVTLAQSFRLAVAEGMRRAGENELRRRKLPAVR